MEASTEYATIITMVMIIYLKLKQFIEAKVRKTSRPRREGYIFASWYLGNSYMILNFNYNRHSVISTWDTIEASS